MKQQSLDKRLNLYLSEKGSRDVSANTLLLAASAVAGVGAALVPPPAEAAIVYSGVLQENEVKVGAESYKVDFDGGGEPEFTFRHSLQSSTKNYQFFSGPGAFSFVGNGDRPDRLNKGLLINDDGLVATSIAVLAVKKGTTDSYGAFLGIDSGYYLGVKFEIGNNTHYGWIQYKANSDATIGTIIDWAYEDVPGKAIKTGDKKNFNWNLFLPAIIAGGGNG